MTAPPAPAPPSAQAATQVVHTHAAGQHACEHCLVPPPQNRSAKIAWGVAAIASGLLVLVFLSGIGSTTSTFLASGGVILLATLLCPIVMGGMMWFMMRKNH